MLIRGGFYTQDDRSAEKPCSRRICLAVFLEGLVAAHLLFPITIVAIAVAGFVAGRSMDVWVLPISAGLALVGMRAFCGSWRDAAAVGVVASLAHVAAALVAVALPDNSWDGLAYHQEAVLRLAAGWNPLWEHASRYGVGEELWLDHYPKGSWIAGAAVLLSTGRIEAGKLFNLTLMMAAAGMVTSVLLRLTPLRMRVAASLGGLAAFNPVSVCQSTTFYVDNLLASTITVLVSGLVLYVAARRAAALRVALLAACLAINVKLTGLVYVAVLLGLFVPIVWWWRGLRAAGRTAAAAAAAGVIGTVLLGYAPYVLNLRDYGDPFYPVTPRWGLTIEPSPPANLKESNRFTRFLVSSVSRSEPVRAPQSTHLKFPFWIGPTELHGLYGADLESGGFGPLYGASLLLGGLGLLTLCAGRSTRRVGGIALLIEACLLVSMFVHTETWWARLVPQAWLLPIVVAVPSLCAPRRSFQRFLGSTLVGLALVSVLVVGANVSWRELKYARATHVSLQAMAAASRPIVVYPGSFRSLRQRFSEARVSVRMVDTPPEANLGSLAPERHPIPVPGNQAFWFESR